MTLPSQTGRTSYRRSDTFRSKHAVSTKLIVGGSIAAVLGIVTWAVFANRDGGSTTPPAMVADEVKDDTATKVAEQTRDPKLSDASASKTQAPPIKSKTNASGPRIVMGEDLPAQPIIDAHTSGSLEAPPTQPPAASLTTPKNATLDTQGDQAPAPHTPPLNSQQSPPQAQPSSNASPRPVSHAQRLIDEGMRQAAAGQLVAARQTLSMALEQLDPYSDDATAARKKLGEINETLVFSPTVAGNDPFARSHKIQSGEMLSTIAKPLGVDWRFIARINDIKDPSRIQAGQPVKIITGRFHVVVRKASYELDLYLGDGSDRVYVRTFSVGLGELDSTPVGRFAVSSRVPNPDWKNPRTGEYFDRNDPKNPIGEFWIGIKGIEEKTRDMQGYGVHGTIDPASIGKQASMGCVRMLADDIALVYEVMTNDVNTIEIVP